jgi:hypothetical protein
VEKSVLRAFEQVARVGLVRIVAVFACAPERIAGRRGRDLVQSMALPAEKSLLLAQVRGSVASVRIMADEAGPDAQGSVQIALSVEAFVAAIAEGGVALHVPRNLPLGAVVAIPALPLAAGEVANGAAEVTIRAAFPAEDLPSPKDLFSYCGALLRWVRGGGSGSEGGPFSSL